MKMTLMKFCGLACLLVSGFAFHAQGQSVGIGTNTPKASALLELQSNNKGILVPRLSTSQRNTIINPDRGLLVFDTDKGTFLFFDGSRWRSLMFVNEEFIPPQSRQSADALPGAFFGGSVDISGDYAIIGAKNWSGPAMQNRGAAFVFFKGSNGWQQQVRLLPSDSAFNDLYGGKVAISGDYAAVSAPTKNNGRGKVYVYKRSGANWNLEAALTRGTSAADNDNFGMALDISISSSGLPMVAVGVPFADGTDKGEVITFIRNNSNGTWSRNQTIIPADLGSGDNFGFAISMDGDYLAVGAPYQDAGSIANKGGVYVYNLNETQFAQQYKHAGTTAGSSFGLSVSLSGTLLAVGAPLAQLYANTSPCVYVLKRSGSAWSLAEQVYLSNQSFSSLNTVYGIAVSVNSNRLMIAAPGGIEFSNGTGIQYNVQTGTVYVYGGNGSALFSSAPPRQIKSDFPFDGDYFGQSIALDPGGAYILSDSRQRLNGQPNTGQVLFGN